MDLLRYQVDELAEANLQDADEDERLEAEEDRNWPMWRRTARPPCRPSTRSRTTVPATRCRRSRAG